MKRYLFLDIDGVLTNTQQYCLYDRSGFCPTNMKVLEYTIKNIPNLEIILSSTWRIWKDWKKSLEENNISKIILDKIIDITDPSLAKGPAILKYIEDHSIRLDQFAVVDDHELRVPNLFKTDSHLGLTIIESSGMIFLLNKNYKFPICLF